ncbi:MAG: hypothetical protein NVS3B10_21710 [Polyangiales bacterium]
MSESRTTNDRRLPAWLAGAALVVAAAAGLGSLRHELVAQHTAGSQARVRDHHRDGLDPARHAVGHCAHSKSSDTERCLAAEDARDRAFDHAMPHRPSK